MQQGRGRFGGVGGSVGALVNFLAEVTWGQPAGQRYAGGLERDSPILSLGIGADHADAEDGADFAAVGGLEFHRHLLLTF